MDKSVAYTTAVVAFVLREPVKAVTKALDEGPVEAKLVHKPGARPVRETAWEDLLYLFAVRALREELTPKARIEFYHALKRAPVDCRLLRPWTRSSTKRHEFLLDTDVFREIGKTSPHANLAA
jgi:hypothetical protein